jgi:PAS domain S-box-containing protein
MEVDAVEPSTSCEPRDVAFVVVDAAGCVALAEGVALQAFGFTSNPASGRPIVALLAGDAPVLLGFQKALAGQDAAIVQSVGGVSFELRFGPRSSGGAFGVAFDVNAKERVEGELRSSRAALQLSQRRLTEAQRVAHIGSFEWNAESNVVTWSDELYRIYGLQLGEFQGTYEAFLDHVSPEDLDRTKSVIFDAFRGARPFAYDHRIVRSDGAVRTLHTVGDVIADEQGRAVRLVGCCWDITELQDSIVRKERAYSLLEGVINATADGLLVVDCDGNVTVFNERLLELWKLTRRDVEHMNFDALLSFVHGQLANGEECLQRVRELATRPDAESFDSLRFLDGRFFERYSRPQRIGGEIVGRVWSYRDVTDRERLLHEAVFLADASRLLASLDLEPALEALAHLSVPFLGDGCAVDLLGAGGPRRVIAISRDPSRAVSTDVSASTLAGHPGIQTVGPHSYMAVPLIMKGTVIGAMTFLAQPNVRYTPRDLELAENLASRVALSVANARLFRGAQEALQARDELLSIAAHEIRGPLTSMHLAVQGLRSGSLDGEMRDRALEIIEREDLRLARFVDELLDVGRIRGGPLRFDFEEVDLANVVREVGAHMGKELTRSGSALTISAAPVLGQWDRFRLEQVVSNLLSNAIRFGLGRPIQIAATAADGCARLVVTDSGLGIPEEAQARLFQPFERAVSARHYGGLGLGLYIVRTIVEGLGGKVSVRSRPGAGATFTVELPQTRPS